MLKTHYRKQDIYKAYKGLGLSQGDTVYFTGNIGRLGLYGGKKETLEAHYQVIFDLIGSAGTLIVPTHTFSFCNTNNIYDTLTTQSETGPFSEFIRQKKASVRQFHAYSSCCAIGKSASAICDNTASHVYGKHSPFERMIDLDAKFVSYGLEPHKSISLVHHVEFLMGVPYRYTKEFNQPCLIGDEVVNCMFYLYVTYKNIGITRDRNRNIFDIFYQSTGVNRQQLGLGKVEALSMNKFVSIISKAMIDNPYLWLENPPQQRPYIY